MGLEYNPGVVDRSGEIMAQGITGAASTVSDAIDKYTQMARQTKAYRQMAVDGLGMDPDEVDKMNLPQLQGKLQGAALKSSRAVQQLMMENEQLKNLALRREGVNDVATSEAMRNSMAAGAPAANPQANPMAQPSFQDIASSGITLNPNGPDPSAMMGGPAPAGPAPVSQPSAMMGGTVNDRIARAVQTPGLNARGMQEVVNAIKGTTPPAMLMQQGLNGDRVYGYGNKLHVVPGKTGIDGPTPVDITELPDGSKAAMARGSKDLKILPKPADAPKVIQLHDEAGNPTGITATWNGKQWKADKKVTGELAPVIDPTTKRAVPGFGMDSTGKVHDFRSTMMKATGVDAGAAETPAAATSDIPTPRSQKEYDALPKNAKFIDPGDGKVYYKK